MSIKFQQTAIVEVEYNINLDPADYIDYTREEAESEIKEFLAEDVDYGDCDLLDISTETVTIPEEFWKEWENLKQNN